MMQMLMMIDCCLGGEEVEEYDFEQNVDHVQNDK